MREFIQVQCASDGAGGVIRLLARRAEQDMQGIADDFRDRPVMGKHDIGHARQVLVEQQAENARLQCLHERREVGDVGE